MNFIKTTDEFVAKKLSKTLKLINQQGNVWTFLNDHKQIFSNKEKKKIVYSNKLEM